MKVNIVCSDPTWIFGKFIAEFRKHSAHTMLLNAKSGFDMAYYLPYYELPVNPFHPCTSWHSHQELIDPLKSKFVSSAQVVDFALSHSKKYAELLSGLGMTNVAQIMPGVDTSFFKQRLVKSGSRSKLVVGYIGRQYTSTKRKNPLLLEKISKLPFVELRTTGGKMPESKLPEFYADLDLVISPALIEGGPMAMLESQAVGVPMMCYDGVGTASEFDVGIIKVSYNNEIAFIKELNKIWVNKKHIEWNTKDYMDKMKEQVASFTWKNFVEKHDKVWESVYASRQNK